MAESWEEYQILDHPSLLDFIFYPRRDEFRQADSEAQQDFDIEVEEGITISCSFYIHDSQAASILFFHGNGELASEYTDVGYIFNQIGINLFVADYRGYGRSGGRPTVSGMIRDAHSLFRGFRQVLADKGFNGPQFIMGRSMGSASAIELAIAHPEAFKGMIIESGFCDVTDLLSRLGVSLARQGSSGGLSQGLARVKKISLPALIIHAENDSIVPLEEGRKIFNGLSSTEKKLVIIPGADHNSIFAVGMQQYLRELQTFVEGHLR